jgi:catechol 2,3-dioxygenase-like lactoylglutathione lyase family enzyme
MLSKAKLTAFAATAQPGRAKAFYQKTLGLRLLTDDQFALAFDSNGVQLRIQKVEKVEPPPFTVLGWEVSSIRRAMTTLSRSGVAFERYTFLEQDEAGVWTAPSGTKVAWFKDPDGNLLSLAESGVA